MLRFDWTIGITNSTFCVHETNCYASYFFRISFQDPMSEVSVSDFC